MTPNVPCKVLEWDSEFFGFLIATVRAEELNPATADDIDRWAAEHRIRCLYLYADPGDVASLRVVRERGYALADVRLDYVLNTKRSEQLEGQPPIPVRTATDADVEALKAIAKVSHGSTRFYRDPHFPRDRCDALYERWIERSCEGWAERVFVAGAEGDPIGYITLHTGARIGLMAVRQDWRRRGVGRALFHAPLDWLSQCGVSTVRACTYDVNDPIKQLIVQLGGRVESTSLVFHRWFD